MEQEIPDPPSHVRLGLDMFSLRSQGLTPFAQLDFCAARGIQVVHFSEIRLLGGLEPDHLRHVRDHAGALGLDLEIGMLSICPSSTIFDRSQGPAEVQLLRMIDAARLVGSPIVRCVVGAMADRRTAGGIAARTADTAQVLKHVRSQAIDAGVRIAVENHAGDMQARELRALVEEAGPDVVGVCIDAGNALWAMEDPLLTLETLAPYVLTSHTRDGAVRRTAQGVAVAWTRMGDGNVGIARYVRAFVETCPGRPLSLEVIVMPAPRLLDFRTPGFWDAYPAMPASEFSRFLDLVDDGAAVPLPSGVVDAAQELQIVEASIRWTQELLRLDRRR